MKEINLDILYYKPEFILLHIKESFFLSSNNTDAHRKISKIKRKLEKYIKLSPNYFIWNKINEKFDNLVKECQVIHFIKKAEAFSEEQFKIKDELIKLDIKKNIENYLPLSRYTELNISCDKNELLKNLKFSDFSSQEVIFAMRMLSNPFLL